MLINTDTDTTAYNSEEILKLSTNEALTDSIVQEALVKAESYLSSQLEGQSMDDNPRLWIAYTLLRSLRIYSKSGNSIPGLNGLGVREGYELAVDILSKKPKIDRDLSIRSYKGIALAFKVEA